MIGYAEKEIFTPRERWLFRQAKALVDAVPYEIDGEPVRCHELARAVGAMLGLERVDGRFGFVEHTWLWLDEFDPKAAPWVLPRILDVYVPGAIPQVQLVDTAGGLPPRYYLSNVFDVKIRHDIIEKIAVLFSDVVLPFDPDLEPPEALPRTADVGGYIALGAATALHGMLDDIDTLGDSMKPESTPYFRRVNEIVRQRHRIMVSDGYSVSIRKPPWKET